MSELGDLLKKAREEKGITLDEMQEQTKIRKRYLEALEQGNYDVLPGKFYIRAFIKNYAEYVGLDAEEVLRYYHIEIPEPDILETDTLPARKPKRLRSSTSEKFGKIGFNLLLWGFLVLVIIVIWYFNINKESDPANQPDGTSITDNSDFTAITTPEPTVDVNVPIATPEPTVVPVMVTKLANKGSADVFEVSPVKESYELVIKATGESWLAVHEGNTESGKQLYYAILKDNEFNATITDDVFLVIGRPGEIEVHLDGLLIEDGDNSKTRKRMILQVPDNNTTAE